MGKVVESDFCWPGLVGVGGELGEQEVDDSRCLQWQSINLFPGEGRTFDYDKSGTWFLCVCALARHRE